MFPTTLRTECNTFVDEYESIIVALITNNVKPDKICQLIGLCGKPEQQMATTSVSAVDEKANGIFFSF